MKENIKEDIKDFYNSVANKFAQTRQKFWPEFRYIKEEVADMIKKKGKVKILELGCGSGRLYTYLLEYFPKEFIEYKGVDISKNLIEIAKNTGGDFIVSDMLEFLEKQDQQSYDIVIAVASFQHIITYRERLLIMKNIYRVLNYDGICIMFNWSFSKWFFKKYYFEIFKSFLIGILSLFTKPINDIFIPWKEKGKTYYRYYHIFFLFELKKLAKLSGFVIKELCYVGQNGEKTVSYKHSRNSMIVCKKTIM